TGPFEGPLSSSGMALSGDGKTLACVSGSSHICLLTANNKNELALAPETRSGIQDVAIAGNQVAYITAGFQIIGKDWESCRERPWLVGHTGSPILVDFTPNGKYLVSANDAQQDNSVSIWDMRKGEEMRRLRPWTGGSNPAVGFGGRGGGGMFGGRD